MKKDKLLNKIFNAFYTIFVKLCIYIYKFIKYVWYGIISPIIFLVAIISRIVIKRREIKVKRLKKQSQKIKEKDRKKEEKKKRTIDLSAYKNENIKLEKKGVGDYINSAISAVMSIPANVKKKIDNAALVKQARNKRAFDTQTMLVDFSDDNEETNGKKVVWEYIAINEKGKKIKGYFEAFSRVDVQSFLLGEGLAVYSIRTSKTIQALHASIGGKKIKIKHLIFMLSQLSTYLKSGIPLVESLNILIKQTEKKQYRSILREVTYDLTVGENFSSALEKRGEAFPKLLINMVKASELTGELPEALDDMVEYYTEAEEVRREMVSALTYPSIVFLFTIAVLTFVMVFVVPKFVEIYETMESAEIPTFTLWVIKVSNYIQDNFLLILIAVFVFVAISYYLYKYVKTIRILFQWIFMHIPVLKDVIIYNEVTLFSKTFSSLLSHNVYITDSMDILNKATNNEIYKMMIVDTIANLARGEKISTAYKDNWAFPVAAYEMIVTGEKTGQLAEMMHKVSIYYQSLHKNIVARVKALVEPFLIIFLTFVVGIILISVIVPMFSMYQQVQKMG